MRSSKVRVLLGLAVLYAGWQVWLWLAAPGKISPDFPPAAQRVNILVTLPFPPERFHVQKFQQFGRVSGTEDTSVEVRGVQRSALEAIARIYWVRRIEPLKPGG
jgi:hypothetical protein